MSVFAVIIKRKNPYGAMQGPYFAYLIVESLVYLIESLSHLLSDINRQNRTPGYLHLAEMRKIARWLNMAEDAGARWVIG